MTTWSSASTNISASTNPSLSAGLVSSSFVDFLPSASAGFVSSLSASPLMSVIQDMIKSFYIKKPSTSANNTIALIYTKKTLWIGKVPFPYLDNAWQYILTISNELQ